MDAGLTVRHARVVNAGVSRAELEGWLGRVEIESLGLAPGETFYVPRLRMRLAAGSAPRAFMAGHILTALRRLLAAADEGWRTRFAPDRPYRFASRARYHAWLVALWVKDGTAPAREAFRAATGHDTLAGWQRATLLRDGPALVAAAARLAELGAAARWIARFEPADLAFAMSALDEAFALDIATAAPASASPSGAAAAFTPAANAVPEAQRALLAENAAALTARGNDWRSLPPPGRALLLATATLARAAIHPAGNLPALAPAIAAFAATAAPAPAPAPPRPVFRPAVELPPAPVRRPAAMAAARMRAPDRMGGSASPPPRPPRVAAAEAAAAPAPRIEPPERRRPALRQRPTVPRANPAPAPAGAPPLLLAPDAIFDTGFGGLLFLINAFVALGLYPDFTRPRGARLELSPLWLADRIGHWRFGARYRRDPLAAWIARHAAPGRLPEAWRAAPHWLAGLERRYAPIRVTTARRTTLWHPDGFPIEDRPARGWRQPGPRMATAPRPPHRLPAAREDRWAACLGLYLDARLRRSAGGGLGLLALPARVEVRDLDLRASFRLDAYPIGLRLAGLDRDPGWQPAEGRAIAFGFA